MSEIFVFISTAFRLCTPLSLAAYGGYFSERSGTINIGLEGMMLFGAFSAAAVAHQTSNPILGLLGGMGAGLLLASLHAILCIHFKTNQIISGLAINLLGFGIPPLLCKAFYGASSGTPALELSQRVQPIIGISPFMFLSFIFCILFWFVHRYSVFGQYLRFAGEHPETLESQGISVKKIRWIGILFSGVLCGIAGSYLSIEHGSGFSRNMTAGRGFIALAALILGRWTPHGAFLGSFIFGLVEASQILLQGVVFPSGQAVPVQWIQMLPYAITLLILSGVGFKMKSSQPPKALGKPFLTILFCCVLLPGCIVPENILQFFNKNIGPFFSLKFERTKQKAISDPQNPTIDDQYVNGEFIRELFKVVLERDLRNEEEFTKYLNVLEQGGHYEGIYNGILYSAEYREKEKGIAPVKAVKSYSEIMAQLSLDQKYDPLKIQEPQEPPDVPPLQKEDNIKPPQPTPLERDGLIAQYEKEAIPLSTYTLKRRLGEELLKTIDLKKAYREKLATWFGKFTFFINKKGTNFGIQQRNVLNEYYHYKWALDTSEDRIKWECLNRIHMTMNTTSSM